MKDFINNDKNLVIIAVLIIALGLMLIPVPPEAMKTITPIVTGLFGLAIGKGGK